MFSPANLTVTAMMSVTKFGFMKTSIDYALQHPQIKDSMKQYLIDLGKELEADSKREETK